MRALGRNPGKLAQLAAAGAEAIAVDLLDRGAVARACEGVGQVYSTVNNVMGKGTSSPHRTDLAAHEALCEASRQAGVRRLVYLSALGMTADSPVDFFRIKYAIDACVRGCEVPWVVLRPTAFMETWVGMLTDGIRKNGVAVLFGDGRTLSNFISVEDVAELSVRVLGREDLKNEIIELGGPTNMSLDDVVTLLERHRGVPVRRRRIPTPVLWWGGILLRPFNEVAARLMRLGYFTATRDGSFDQWRLSAERFGVAPRSIESFVQSIQNLR